MTYSPRSYLDIRALFIARTGLPAASLGIQHWSPQGGGYHEGNDLLATAGRLDTDYSKRESDRDRPGTDGAAAIDIGWFDVTLPGGRRVTLIDLNRWLLSNVDASDALWIREFIYTLDRVTVRRYDRLGIRTSGDSSHLTHTHISGHRDEENTPKAPLFQRFWDEMEGRTGGGEDMKAYLTRAAGDPTVWVGDGVASRTVASMPTTDHLVASGATWLPDFPTPAAMFDRIGPPAQPTVDVDEAVLASALAGNTVFISALASALAARVGSIESTLERTRLTVDPA